MHWFLSDVSEKSWRCSLGHLVGKEVGLCKEGGVGTIAMIHVLHKIIQKRTCWKEEKKVIDKFAQLLKIELPTSENLFIVGYYYKYTTQDVLCIVILQLLKFRGIKFEIVETWFLN